MPFATYDDLIARPPVLPQASAEQVETLMGDAAVWLSVWFRPFGDLVTLAEDDAELAEFLKVVSCSMVRRALTTGAIEGAASTYQVMGPFSTQIAYKNPDGNLYITSAERDAILALLGVNVSGAVSASGPGL
ncbi:hypothetical protein [Nocardia brasiliensis]|uniref:hypothetical protein n=1 Tax=Nocardia brasiliensis TaxID=37326 RepID=UPI002457BA10|nr:hypothetical protein [Nocardia brasiliensis]